MIKLTISTSYLLIKFLVVNERLLSGVPLEGSGSLIRSPSWAVQGGRSVRVMRVKVHFKIDAT